MVKHKLNIGKYQMFTWCRYAVAISVTVALVLVFVNASTKYAYACSTFDISCKWHEMWEECLSEVAAWFAELFVYWMKMPVTGAITGIDISEMGSQPFLPQNVSIQPFGPFGITVSIAIIIGYLKWITAAIAMVMLVIYFGRLSWLNKQGASTDGLKTLLYITIGMLMTCGAITLTSTVIDYNKNETNNIVQWITGQIWPFMMISVIFGVMITAIKVIIEQSGKPIKELFETFFIIIAVVNFSSILVLLLGAITDQLSLRIVSNAFGCGSEQNYDCIKQRIVEAFTVHDIGWFIILIFCLLSLIVVLVQSIIFVGRTIMLVCVVGTLGISASLRYTKLGKEGLEKSLAWIFSLIMYKPLVAIVYSVAFKTMESEKENGFWGFIYCIAAAFMGIVCLPMLIKLMMPAASSVTDPSSGFGLGQIMQPLYLLSTMKNLFSSGSGGGPQGASGGGGGGGGGAAAASGAAEVGAAAADAGIGAAAGA